MPGAPEFRDHRQRLLQRLPRLQRALPGELDGDAVGHRVGEGHAELDDVGAGRGQGGQDRGRGGEVGVAGGDEGHERGAALGSAGLETGLDASLAGGGLDIGHGPSG